MDRKDEIMRRRNVKLSATRLRQNLYQHLDTVIQTGVPLEIDRNGHVLRIVLAERKSKLENLEPHDLVVGDPLELARLEWSGDWDEERNL